MALSKPLADIPVAEIRHLTVANPTTIGPEATLHELVASMIEDLRTRSVYVVDEDGHLIGYVHMADVVEHLFPLEAMVVTSFEDLLREASHLGGRCVRDVMTVPVPSVRDSTPLREVALLLMKEHLQELAVVNDDGQLIGQVNVYEIIRAYLMQNP